MTKGGLRGRGSDAGVLGTAVPLDVGGGSVLIMLLLFMSSWLAVLSPRWTTCGQPQKRVGTLLTAIRNTRVFHIWGKKKKKKNTTTPGYNLL